MARKGILGGAFPGLPDAGTAPAPPAPRPTRAAAVGALQSSLSRMQESAVQEIDPELIDDAGIEDRLGEDDEARRTLRDSLATYGQQVPILVRPHPGRAGRYEVVYGRRRLAALREIGRPVRALVRQLDDHALVLAQGQENTARRELSFVEKASFAAQRAAQGYDRKTICDALTIDLPMVSRMLKVGKAFPLPVLRRIGSAPSVGRERWLALARAAEDPLAWTRADHAMALPGFETLTSDARFDAVHAAVTRPAPRPAPAAPATRPLPGPDGADLGTLRRGPKGVTLTVHARAAPGFDAWLDTHAEALLAELHARWSADRDPA